MENLSKQPKDVQAQASALIMRPVRMVVIHKPSNQAVMKDVPLAQCRRFFEACVSDAKAEGKFVGLEDSDFIAVQIDWEDKTVITSSL